MNMKVVKWSRTPKHIMRMKCLEELIRDITIRSFFEVGAGTGDFTRLFLERGCVGTCYDLGSENRQILRENLKEYEDRLTVLDDLPNTNERFDALLSFEVLEHIENDNLALETWTKLLKPGGVLLVSVPSHMKKYSLEDKRVGHVRRYEKKELTDLVTKAGYSDIEIRCYGYPLGNITRKISLFFARQELSRDENLSMEERSIKSGVERTNMANKLAFLFNPITLLPFLMLQRLFYDKDLGDGFVLSARKLD